MLPQPLPPRAADPPPTRTVTFLFTDIEDSRRLWQVAPEAMHASLAQHDANLDTWVEQGIPPPKSTPIELDTSGAKPSFVFDAHGNMKGGVRTPYVDVPIATYTPDGSIWSWATKVRFSDDKLRSLYQTRKNYLERVTESTRAMVGARWITANDAQRIIDEAAQAKVPSR